MLIKGLFYNNFLKKFYKPKIKIDLLKIDVEGLEMEVLRGASKKLDKIEFIMIELNNNSKKYGSNNIEIEEHIQSLGFKELIKTWPDIVYRKA